MTLSAVVDGGMECIQDPRSLAYSGSLAATTRNCHYQQFALRLALVSSLTTTHGSRPVATVYVMIVR